MSVPKSARVTQIVVGATSIYPEIVPYGSPERISLVGRYGRTYGVERARRVLAVVFSEYPVGGAPKGYGNAIVPGVAAQFIAAFMECRP